jgi:hypothetical protein
MPSAYSIMVRRPDSGLPWPTRHGSQRSSPRTVTPTWRDLSDAWGAWQTYWREPTAKHREACRESLLPETIRDWQYLHGSDPQRVSPDGYTLDIAYMNRPDAQEKTARPDSGLPNQCGQVPRIPEIFPHLAAAAAGRLGQERAGVYPAGSRGLPPRYTLGRGSFSGYGAFCIGNPWNLGETSRRHSTRPPPQPVHICRLLPRRRCNRLTHGSFQR